MLSALSPTDVAYVLAAVVQGAAALLWVCGSSVLAEAGRPARLWALFAAASAASFGCLVAGMGLQGPSSEWLRAAGNITLVIGLLALGEGLDRFTGLRVRRGLQGLVLVVTLGVSWIGLRPEMAPLRISVLASLQGLLVLAMAWRLHGYVRRELPLPAAWLLPLPLWLGSLAFGQRGVWALLAPGSVAQTMTVNSGYNIGTAFAYIALALSLHVMLMLLVMMRLTRDLRRLARHDSLTGLLNRRTMEEALAAQWQRSRRSGEAFCLLMVDADHFKSINDRWGHPVGDQALRRIADTLGRELRAIDQLARFGGEEFLLLLPGLALGDGLLVAERLRERVMHTVFEQGGQRIALAVSIGVAAWAGPQETPDRLLARADAALYRAKRLGRNCVVPAEPDLRDAASTSEPLAGAAR